MKMYGVGGGSVDVNVFMCVPTSLSQSLVTVKSGGVVCFVLYFKWVVYFVLYFMLVICFVLYFKSIICFVLHLKCGLFVAVEVHISILDSLGARTSVCSLPIKVTPRPLATGNQTEEDIL